MLVGRGAELAAIERLLAGARAGRGGVLLVHGEPGIGKTALLAQAGVRASGMTRLGVTGIEAESELALSALAELLAPLEPRLSLLPERQADALRAAMALGPPTDGDRFAVWAGALGLLTAGAAEGPLLVTLDDAHWLDRPSVDCFAYAARRLRHRPIAMLVAVRTGEPHGFQGREFAGLALEPLEAEESRELLRGVAPDLPPGAVEGVLRWAAGNPLALLELPAVLTAEQRAGRAPLEEPMKPGRELRRAFDRGLGRLSGPARLALLVAAAAGSRSLGPIVAACRSLPVDPAALEEAETAGLVRLAPSELDFAHPLVRGAVYDSATPAERRRAHRALADAVGDEGRAWHLAAAALEPDETIAEALEQAAERAAARGGQVVAVDALERAAALSPGRRARNRRLLAAGRVANAAGIHARAVAALEEAAEAEEEEVRVESSALLAHASLYGGHVGRAMRLFEREGGRLQGRDPLAAAARFADAALAASIAGDCRRACAAAERGATLLPDDADPGSRAHVISVLSWCQTLRGRTREARSTLASVDDALSFVDPASHAGRSIALAVNNRLASEDFERTLHQSRASALAAREAGGIGALPFLLLVELDAAYRLGQWDWLEEQIAEATRLGEETGQRGPLTHVLTIRARLAAVQGREPESRAAAERALAIAEPAGMGSVVAMANAALGVLELGVGRIAAATAILEKVWHGVEAGGLAHPALIPWSPDLLETYVRAGNLRGAAELLGWLERQANDTGSHWAATVLARCRGMVATQQFERHFEEALHLHQKLPSSWERGRTLLVYGERLHRARRRAEARERLRDAQAAFERLGARPWAERAATELRAAGGRRRTPRRDRDELSARELEIARLVARGATNREVATELFLSPKTIEFHLGQIYRKLGIRSRTQLLATLAHAAPSEVGSAGPPESNGSA